MSIEPVIIGDATLAKKDYTSIYALCEWPSMEPRYVGKTIQFLIDRRKAHIRSAKNGGKLPVHYWLRKRMAAGGFCTQLLEHIPAGGDWIARERYWIEKYRAAGHHLLNLTAGGEGLAGHKFTIEHRAKIASALRTGDHFTCLACGAEFYRKRNAIKRGHTKYCSRICSNRATKGGWSCRAKK